MTVATEASAESSTQQPVHTRALIIGTGFSGLGMAIALQKQGVDFIILEKADEIGGTWRDNSYPGCACDVPSHLYSFSFEPNPAWSRAFSPQAEIFAYLYVDVTCIVLKFYCWASTRRRSPTFILSLFELRS